LKYNSVDLIARCRA